MQRLNENVENQRGIVKIASSVIVFWANKIKANVRRNGYESKGFIPKILANEVFRITSNSGTPLKGLPEKLQAFLKERFRLSFTVEWKDNVNYSGIYKPREGYGHGEISIVISDKDFEFIRNPRSSHEVIQILKKYQSVIVHELTHAYDDWASKGKYITSQRSKDGLGAQDDPSGRTTYLNSAHEISARFNQAIHDLPEPNGVSWRSYMTEFKTKIQGWQNIPASEKKRLLTRLATYFIQHNPSNPLLDISSKAEQLQQKVREQTGDPYLQIIAKPDDDKIIVRPTIFDKKSVDQQAVFSGMKAICNMADIYRRTVAISYIPLPVAVQLGFVRNKGRRKDFSHSEQFYRLPKRN